MEYTSKKYALSHWHNPFHVQEVLQYLQPKKEETILEIGCSRGFMAQALQQLGFSVYGVDANKQAIETGIADNLQYMSATNLQFANNSFDKLYSFHTIEHIPETGLALQEMARVVKSKGTILLVYPAELIRGMFALGAAIMLWKNPRDIHVVKLTPAKLQKLTEPIGLRHKKSTLSLLGGPQFISVFEKE
jgi:ubiquinone/menaquinone biosynthesis C-methylase UbiE